MLFESKLEVTKETKILIKKSPLAGKRNCLIVAECFPLYSSRKNILP